MNRKRVVLLARPGMARDRTQAAIAEAGADIAALLDPGAATEIDVRNTAPDVVMVILDPAVEAVLDKFDGVLGDPGFEIMFEDADVAAKREGWEAARWSRHLNAKLYGHQDVLPRAKGEPAMVDDGQRTNEQDLRFKGEMDALQERVATLAETPDGAATGKRNRHGALVIAAGIGGPDAVRQLLGGLPAGFQRPIVLCQRLEGGQYDKLVRQMQRATPLQVVLAQVGDPLQAGTVHVMPEGLGVQGTAAGLVFAPVSSAPDFSALLPAESGLLLLSGADVALVDAAMSLGWAGGLALGQSQENCFDPTASNALVARGGQAANLSKLPLKLLERWPV
ncbi:MAG: chemotaxis protein CheB [Thermomonas sp.]